MAAPMEKDGVPTIDLLHPEILSTDGILELFRRRNVRVDPAKTESKDDLVSLYYTTILPMPQRKYRNNRKGRLMTKSQLLIDKRHKRPKDDDSDLLKTANRNLASGSFTPIADRLKPPPDEAKKGVLNLKSKPYGIGQDKSENPLDRVIIKTFVKKKNSSNGSSDSETKTPVKSTNVRKHKKLVRLTVPEPPVKIEDPLDKIVIKTFVKKRPSESTDSPSQSAKTTDVACPQEKVQKVSNDSTPSLTGDNTGRKSPGLLKTPSRRSSDDSGRKSPGLKMTIDIINKHLSHSDKPKLSPETEKSVDCGSSLGKRPTESSSVTEPANTATPTTKKRKIKINRTSV